MRISIGKFILTSALLAVLALTANIPASAVEPGILIKVPFNFIAAGKPCSAGTYSVGKDLYHNFVSLRSIDGTRSFLWLLKPDETQSKDGTASLRFDTVGPNHILHSVRYESLTTDNLNPPPKLPEHTPSKLTHGQ